MKKCVRFKHNTKIFVNESLIMIKKNIAYNYRKLKRGGLIFACFTRDSIVHIKKKIIFG